jgi:hypothetical protein
MQVVIFLLCLFSTLALGWMVFLPGLFTSVIQNRTGCQARVDYFYANPFTAEVRMRGLVIVNPTGFSEGNFLEVHQFSAKADLFSVLTSNPVIDMTTIDVTRVNVVTNARGSNNLDLIYRRMAAARNTKPATKPAAKPGVETASPAYLVQKLDLRVGQVVVKDERPGRESERVHQLAFRRDYRDVTSLAALNNGLPAEVTAAGVSIGEVVPADLKRVVLDATRPIDRKTYAWGENRENVDWTLRKLEDRPKP